MNSDGEPKIASKPIPVVRVDMGEGPGASQDHAGNLVYAEEWVKVKCVICGAVGSTPKPREGHPDPETGEYRAACGRCATGRKINFFGAHNRRERRQRN